MGHQARPNKVDNYAHVLNEIKAAIDSGHEIRFPCPLERVVNESEKVRSILRSAELFTNRQEGRYADLNQRVVTSADWEGQCVVVRPKQDARSGSLRPKAPDEMDAARTVRDKATELNFKPSSGFTPERFDAFLRENHGYTIRHLEDTPGDPFFDIPDVKAGDFNELKAKADGWKCYIAKRLVSSPERPKTDLLKQFGFSRDDS